MQIIVVSLTLCIILCLVTSSYLRDSTNYLVLNVMVPKNNFYAPTSKMGLFSLYPPNRVNVPQYFEPRKFRKFYKTRRAYSSGKIQYKDPYLKRVYEDITKLMVPVNEVHSFKVIQRDMRSTRTKLAALFFQISAMASDTAAFLQTPNRRFFVNQLLTVPTAACNASLIMLKSLVPMGSPNSTFSFLLNSNNGASVGVGGNLGDNAQGSAGANGGGAEPAAGGGGGGNGANAGGAPAQEQPGKYYRTNRNLSPLEGLRQKVEQSIKTELLKIINISHNKNSPDKIATADEKKIINDAFVRISKIGNDAFSQLIMGPTRRLNFLGNIVDNIYKSCTSKANLLTSFIPFIGNMSASNLQLLQSLNVG